jgi:hypothetical protein
MEEPRRQGEQIPVVYCASSFAQRHHSFEELTMALMIASDAPTLFIRRAAYEASGLTRAALDERLGLTPDEFRAEGNLVAIGPIHGESEGISELIAELEGAGLVYHDDFFELSGNWPGWLRLHASSV